MNEVNANEINNCDRNIKTYRIYKMFAYDWLFYYAISVVFLTTVKNFTVSEIMFFSSTYAFSGFLLYILSSSIVNKLNNKKSIILGNILQLITCIVFIFSNNFYIFLLTEVILSFGFSLKGLAEGNILYGSLKRINQREKFSKIEGIANSRYFYLEALSGFISGYLFTINGYYPMYCTFIILIIGTIISFRFKDYELQQNEENNNEETLKKYLYSFKKVIKSDRAKSIFIYSSIFNGIIACSLVLYKSILLDLNVTASYVVIIASIQSIIVGIGTKIFYYTEQKLKNWVLTVFSIIFILGLFSIGIITKNKIFRLDTLIIMFVWLIFMALIQGAYRIAMKKYVVSFTTSKIRTKVLALYYMFEGIGQSVIMFISGILLKYNSNSEASMIVALLSFILVGISLIYMKGKLGLKPNEYQKKEIYEE